MNENIKCFNKLPVSICTLKSLRKYSVPCEERSKHNGAIWKVLKEDWQKNESLFDDNFRYGWKQFTQVKNVWDAEKKSYYNIYRKLKCQKPTFLEFAGTLSDRMVAENSSCLDRCPSTHKFLVTKTELANFNLKDISILTKHVYLQYIDLSHNNIEDASALGSISYLIYLDLSFNKLTKLLDFKPPWKLTYVNYSHNKLVEISDISAFWTITHLNLSYNEIKEIKNLDKLNYLEVLDLSHNKIEILINLHANPLRYLNLEYNLIWSFKNDAKQENEKMNDLINLNLSHNFIEDVLFLEMFGAVKDLDISFNSINNISCLNYFSELNRIEFLNLIENPIVEWPNYRMFFIKCLNFLRVLDEEEVTTLEKIKAKETQLIGGERFESLFFYAKKNLCSKRNKNLGGGFLPFDQNPYPIIALSGPLVGIKNIIELIYKDRHYNKKFYFIKCICTESQLFEMPYSKVVTNDEFNNYLREGHFKAIGFRLGIRIGLSNSELNNCIRSGKIGLMNVPLNLVQNLRLAGTNPFVIVTFPDDKLSFEKTLTAKFFISTLIDQEGAYFLKKRQPNIINIPFNGEDIIDELLLRIIPSYEMNEHYLDELVKKVEKTCTDEIEELKSQDKNLKTFYNESLNNFLSNKANKNTLINFGKSYRDNEECNIFSSKFMRTSLLQKQQEQEQQQMQQTSKNTLPLSIESEFLTFSGTSSNDSGDDSSFYSKSGDSKIKRKTPILSREDLMFTSNSYSQEGEEKLSAIYTLKLPSLEYPNNIQIIKGPLEEEIKRKKKIINVVSRVFFGHLHSLFKTYLQANILHPGLFSQCIFFQPDTFPRKFIKCVKSLIKNPIPPFEQIQNSPEYKTIYDQKINFIKEELLENSTISRKQGFYTKGNQSKICKFL